MQLVNSSSLSAPLMARMGKVRTRARGCCDFVVIVDVVLWDEQKGR